MNPKYFLISYGLFAILSSSAHSEEFGGVNFPQGEVSFADRVVSYEPDFSGGNISTRPGFTSPTDSLGAPDFSFDTDRGSVSLGSGGRITLEFTNNVLTGSDNETVDLHVFEIGVDVEDTFVELSSDGVTWFAVGKVFGASSAIDIDAFGFGSDSSFRFVRLTDDPNEGQSTGETVGADIDAVGAITTRQVVDEPELEIQRAIVVEFQSALGSSYSIQSSLGLTEEDWVDEVVGIQGDGKVLQFFFEVSDPKKFYRIAPPRN